MELGAPSPLVIRALSSMLSFSMASAVLASVPYNSLSGGSPQTHAYLSALWEPSRKKLPFFSSILRNCSGT